MWVKWRAEKLKDFPTLEIYFHRWIAQCHQLEFVKECCKKLDCNEEALINSLILFLQLKLLHSGHLSDMEFEVITTSAVSEVSLASTPVAIIAPSGNTGYDYNDGTAKKEYHIFKAHRVIVAARCEYLRKALLSGMQEDINRYWIIAFASRRSDVSLQENNNFWYIACDISTIFTLSVWCAGW